MYITSYTHSLLLYNSKSHIASYAFLSNPIILTLIGYRYYTYLFDWLLSEMCNPYISKRQAAAYPSDNLWDMAIDRLLLNTGYNAGYLHEQAVWFILGLEVHNTVYRLLSWLRVDCSSQVIRYHWGLRLKDIRVITAWVLILIW